MDILWNQTPEILLLDILWNQTPEILSNGYFMESDTRNLVKWIFYYIRKSDILSEDVLLHQKIRHITLLCCHPCVALFGALGAIIKYSDFMMTPNASICIACIVLLGASGVIIKYSDFMMTPIASICIACVVLLVLVLFAQRDSGHHE